MSVVISMTTSLSGADLGGRSPNTFAYISCPYNSARCTSVTEVTRCRLDRTGHPHAPQGLWTGQPSDPVGSRTGQISHESDGRDGPDADERSRRIRDRSLAHAEAMGCWAPEPERLVELLLFRRALEGEGRGGAA